MDIGEGLAAFGRNYVAGQQAQENLKIQKQELKLRQDRFAMEQMEYAYKQDVEDKRRETNKRLNDVNRSFDPMTKGTQSTPDIYNSYTKEIAQPQGDVVFSDPAGKETLGEISTKATGIEKKSSLYDSVLNVEQDTKRVKSPLSGLGDFDIPTKTTATQLPSKPTKKSALDFATNAVKENRRNSLMGRLKYLAVDIPKTLLGVGGDALELADDTLQSLGVLPDEELVAKVEELLLQEKSEKSEKLGVDQPEFIDEKQPLRADQFGGGGLEGVPLEQREGVIQETGTQSVGHNLIQAGIQGEAPRAKTFQEMDEEVYMAHSQVPGYSDLSPKEREEHYKVAMRNQVSESQRVEALKDVADLNKVLADTAKIYADMNPGVDQERVAGQFQNYPEFSEVEFRSGDPKNIRDFIAEAAVSDTQLSSIDSALEMADKLWSGEVDITSQEGINIQGALEGITAQLIGQNRIPITGPGVLTEADKTMIRDAIGNLAGWSNMSPILYKRQRFRATEYRDRLKRTMVNRSKVYSPESLKKKLPNQFPNSKPAQESTISFGDKTYKIRVNN